MEQTPLKRVCLLFMIVLIQTAEAPLMDPNISPHICKLLFFLSLLIQLPRSSVFFDFLSLSLLFSPLSNPSSLEQGCFRFLLSPKPFSFGWSVKDSDDQRWEARRPAGEGVQEAARI